MPLKVAAPVLMGFLGKESKQQGVSDQNGVGNLLSGMLGGGGEKEQSLVTRLLDSDGDGSIIDDIAGMVMNSGGSKKSSGLGGLLGSLFGKK